MVRVPLPVTGRMIMNDVRRCRRCKENGAMDRPGAQACSRTRLLSTTILPLITTIRNVLQATSPHLARRALPLGKWTSCLHEDREVREFSPRPHSSVCAILKEAFTRL